MFGQGKQAGMTPRASTLGYVCSRHEVQCLLLSDLLPECPVFQTFSENVQGREDILAAHAAVPRKKRMWACVLCDFRNFLEVQTGT